MKNPIFVIDTSDSRMYYTLRYIKSKKYTAYSLDNFDYSNKAIFCYSPAKKLTISDIEKIPPESYLLAGKVNGEIHSLIKEKNITYINTLTDEVYAIENAVQTAEASLMLIIRATTKSIYDLNIGILGYGRIGRALSKIFSSLGLTYNVYTKDYYEQAIAHLYKCNVYDLNGDISDCDVIINTIPAKTLAYEQLKTINNSCYILDLASHASIDSCDVNSLGLVYDNALGLPGKYSPQSAGEILGKSILRFTESKLC